MCEIDKGNPKYTTFTEFVQVRNFITFELKFIRHEERDTQSFNADCFYIVSSQPNQRATPVAEKFVWPRPGLTLDSLVRRQELNSLLFSNPKNSQPTLPVHDVIHTSWSYFLSGVLFWHLWMMHPPCVRVNTCAHVCTSLNHALSRKVLILTKPKGKISKKKSLRNDITLHNCKLFVLRIVTRSCNYLQRIIIYSSRVFYISISWWFFTRVWVKASLLKSPGFVSVFWPSSAMLSFG